MDRHHGNMDCSTEEIHQDEIQSVFQISSGIVLCFRLEGKITQTFTRNQSSSQALMVWGWIIPSSVMQKRMLRYSSNIKTTSAPETSMNVPTRRRETTFWTRYRLRAEEDQGTGLTAVLDHQQLRLLLSLETKNVTKTRCLQE